MPCRRFELGDGTRIVVCTPTITEVSVHTDAKCPNCGGKRMLWECQAWYGARSTCLKCGDSYEDGVRFERPLERGWRRKSVERAKARWKTWQKAHPKGDV